MPAHAEGEPIVSADWVDRLSQCLQDLVDYERWLESELVDLRRRAERTLGVPDSRDDRDDRVRERVSGYWRVRGSRPLADYEYGRSVAGKLDRLVDVLLEHPVLAKAVYRDGEGSLAVGLNLGVSLAARHQFTSVLTGLVDHAVEQAPKATADAFARMIQKGEDYDLRCYSIALVRGLHAGRRYDFPDDLSVVPLEEARRYLRDTDIRSMLGAADTHINRRPVAAVVFERKWGPVFVPAGFDMDELVWHGRPPTFRDDGRLLVDVLSVVHREPMASSETHTAVVERQLHHIVGSNGSYSPRFVRDMLGANTMKIEPVTTPAFSAESLPECERLFVACRSDEQLRLALSRLASSLRRTGAHGTFDRVVDIAIALEVMYQLDVSRGKGDQLSRRARELIGGDRADLNWIRGTAESTYRARRDIVHDGTLPENAEQVCENGFDLARRTLLHIVSTGWPEW